MRNTISFTLLRFCLRWWSTGQAAGRQFANQGDRMFPSSPLEKKRLSGVGEEPCSVC